MATKSRSTCGIPARKDKTSNKVRPIKDTKGVEQACRKTHAKTNRKGVTHSATSFSTPGVSEGLAADLSRKNELVQF